MINVKRTMIPMSVLSPCCPLVLLVDGPSLRLTQAPGQPRGSALPPGQFSNDGPGISSPWELVRNGTSGM